MNDDYGCAAIILLLCGIGLLIWVISGIIYNNALAYPKLRANIRIKIKQQTKKRNSYD